jgi:hypothetical protein
LQIQWSFDVQHTSDLGGWANSEGLSAGPPEFSVGYDQYTSCDSRFHINGLGVGVGKTWSGLEYHKGQDYTRVDPNPRHVVDDPLRYL